MFQTQSPLPLPCIGHTCYGTSGRRCLDEDGSEAAGNRSRHVAFWCILMPKTWQELWWTFENTHVYSKILRLITCVDLPIYPGRHEEMQLGLGILQQFWTPFRTWCCIAAAALKFKSVSARRFTTLSWSRWSSIPREQWRPWQMPRLSNLTFTSCELWMGAACQESTSQ